MRRMASPGAGSWKFHEQAKMLVRETDHELFFHVARVGFIKRHQCLEAFVGIQTYCDPRLDGVFVKTWNTYRVFKSNEHIKNQIDAYTHDAELAINNALLSSLSSEQMHLLLSESLVEEKIYRMALRALLFLNDHDFESARHLLDRTIALSKEKPLNGYLVRGVWLELLSDLLRIDPEQSYDTFKTSMQRVREAIFHERSNDQVNYHPWSI